jgi:cytochrome c oxidase assembly factor CtaG
MSTIHGLIILIIFSVPLLVAIVAQAAIWYGERREVEAVRAAIAKAEGVA